MNELNPSQDAFETPPADDPQAAILFPWPPGGGKGFADALVETWKWSVFRPGTFFRSMPTDTGLGSALGYYLLVGILAAGITLFWTMVLPVGEPMFDEILGERAADPLVQFLFSPVMLLVSLLAAGGITHVLLLLFGGAHHGFSTTLAVFAFAYSPQLFGVVPRAGAVVGFAWMVALAMIGLKEAHGARTWQAVLAVSLPLGGALLFLAAAAVFLAAGAV